MPGRLEIASLRLPAPRHAPWQWRCFREWCFVKVVARQLWPRMALTLGVLVAGGLLFRSVDPSAQGSLLRGIYSTWLLIFAQPPGPFPETVMLQVMYFALPFIGLVVIVQSLVDVAVLVRDRRRHEREWCAMIASALKDHIVLVGLGRLGVRSFDLLRRLGERVVVIETNPANQFLEEVRRDGSPLIIGDARRDNVLAESNIREAKAILLCTTDDLANLEIALDARRFNPNVKVVLRMFDQGMADKVAHGFNIQQAMSQSAVSAPSFALAAMDSTIVGSTVVGDRLIVMKRWTVQPGDGLCDRAIGDVMAERGVGVVERSFEGQDPMLFPPPATMLAAGDRLTLQGEYAKVMKLRTR